MNVSLHPLLTFSHAPKQMGSRKRMNHRSLSFSGCSLPSSQRGKTSLTFYKLGGAVENLLGKWFNVDCSKCWRAGSAAMCAKVAGDKKNSIKKIVWPFQCKCSYSLLRPCPSAFRHWRFNWIMRQKGGKKATATLQGEGISSDYHLQVRWVHLQIVRKHLEQTDAGSRGTSDKRWKHIWTLEGSRSIQREPTEYKC